MIGPLQFIIYDHSLKNVDLVISNAFFRITRLIEFILIMNRWNTMSWVFFTCIVSLFELSQSLTFNNSVLRVLMTL